MGRNKEPIALVEMKGKSHKTKAEKEKRKKEEIHAQAEHIVPPGFLSPKEKKRFEEIAKQLQEIGIMADLDVPALARYVVAEDQYETLTQLIRRNLLCENGLDQPETLTKLLNAQDKLFRQCRSSAADLGMTITSRCRIVIPKPEEKPKNPFDDFEDEAEAPGVG